MARHAMAETSAYRVSRAHLTAISILIEFASARARQSFEIVALDLCADGVIERVIKVDGN